MSISIIHASTAKTAPQANKELVIKLVHKIPRKDEDVTMNIIRISYIGTME